jgi:hypothetical protein
MIKSVAVLPKEPKYVQLCVMLVQFVSKNAIRYANVNTTLEVRARDIEIAVIEKMAGKTNVIFTLNYIVLLIRIKNACLLK